MKKSELDAWYKQLRQYKNGYHMELSDIIELVQLNHLVMEEAHRIHNDNMLEVRKTI